MGTSSSDHPQKEEAQLYIPCVHGIQRHEPDVEMRQLVAVRLLDLDDLTSGMLEMCCRRRRQAEWDTGGVALACKMHLTKRHFRLHV